MSHPASPSSSEAGPGLAQSTGLIHHPYTPPAEFEAPQPAVHKASTVFFPNVAAARSRQWLDKSAYTYGLHGTPTTFTLEERIATLEGGLQCLLAPSGLAALALVNLALLKSGDEVLLPDNAYGPGKDIATGDLERFGIKHHLYDPMNVADLAERITPRTRLVWLEAAGSVTLEFPDLIAQVRLCRDLGVLCALDNTWGAGLAFNPFDLDGRGLAVDVSTHALTKYPSGGGDVLMGSVVTRDAVLHMKLKLCHMRQGTGVAGNDAEAILRSLPSLPLRYGAADRSARQIAHWASRQAPVAQVLHPALPASPGHAHWRAVCGRADDRGQGAAASLLSLLIHPRYSSEQVDAFCDALRLFRIGYSWGGPVSLVMPYQLQTMRARWPAHIARGTLVRLAIGLEDAADLQADLAQAMQSALPA